MIPFTLRVHHAIDLAARVHADLIRKDPDVEIRYVAHVYGVALLLTEYSFPEEVVIAGLLHDSDSRVRVLEDRPQFADLVTEFGERVVDLVRQVSEQKRDADGAKLPWKVRKEAFLLRLRTADPEAKAIFCADQIHNMESSLMVLERGADPWINLNARRDDQLAKLQAQREALATGWQHPLLERYDAALAAVRGNGDNTNLTCTQSDERSEEIAQG